ncbi:hypothetical protein L0669_20555 [Flavobacterium bizetiae]|uniref:hypothetical protein n=1 Tax=Flavobacterium bizetiae TaxID=2704140 RepID=UPI0021E81032|nr:hypothetical protein [Flavobacterium bizetiae]UTN03707.1 hypothetical protein L0669_20555 [Flavobacterium bizetiae]
MKKYILLAVCTMLYSCTCRQINLTYNEKEWLNLYKKGDVLIFKSNKGNIDTIMVINQRGIHYK